MLEVYTISPHKKFCRRLASHSGYVMSRIMQISKSAAEYATVISSAARNYSAIGRINIDFTIGVMTLIDHKVYRSIGICTNSFCVMYMIKYS
jgi:hypothetical protein